MKRNEIYLFQHSIINTLYINNGTTPPKKVNKFNKKTFFYVFETLSRKNSYTLKL